MKPCDCCEGIESIPPLSVANPPGLDTLACRIGSHATFLERMKARLSSLLLGDGLRPLKNLTARDDDDPAIAWLDAWATVADVLTFYQERIANEGYLRTATERRSILELARLVGYKLRPGVAATGYLAFTLDNGYAVTIPAGSRAQSIPGAGELPQPFETTESLPARDVWNNLKPRLTQPQVIRGDETDLYLEGINTNLKPNDPLVFDFGERVYPRLVLRQVERVITQAAENRTQVILQSIPELQQVAVLISQINRVVVGLGKGPEREMADRVNITLAQLQTGLASVNTMAGLAEAFDKALPAIQQEHKVATDYQYKKLKPWVEAVATALAELAEKAGIYDSQVRGTALLRGKTVNNGEGGTAVSHLANYLTTLAKPASLQPANSLKLGRSISQTYTANSDVAAKLLRILQPALASVLYQSWRNLPLTAPAALSLYTLRTRASVFAHNAPLRAITNDEGQVTGHEEWTFVKASSLVEEMFTLVVDIRRLSGDGWAFTTAATLDRGRGEERDHPLNVGELFSFDIQQGSMTLDTMTIMVLNVEFHQEQFNELLAFDLEFAFAARPIFIQAIMRRDSEDSEGNNIHVHVISSEAGNPPTVNHTQLNMGRTSERVDFSLAGKVLTETTVATEEATVVWLDAGYGQIVPGSWVVLARPYAIGNPDSAPETIIASVLAVSERSRAEYGITGKSTRLELERAWIDPALDDFRVIRETAVFAQSDLLTLAEAPIDEAVCGTEIELEGLYDGLEAGRWLIINGERTDIQADENSPELPGLTATERVMLAGVEQIFDPGLPDEKTHTKLLLAEALAYCYKRDTVTIYGNVAKASHGETRQEVLGSGDGRQPFQAFTLKQPPLTYISDPNPSGIQSSLTVRVNDIKWHEVDNLTELGPNDREFITKTNNEDKTTVIFGDGRYGTRLPTGIENVKAVYRSGIGKVGNVSAGQISLLVTRPLGVKAVINPLPTSGGANRDSVDQARHNIPLAVMSLDRLVSTQDYADFARTFGGIGKASAIELTDGRREVVHLTIAGVDDSSIEKSSDLYRYLRQALHQFGDPYQPVQIDLRQRKLLIISARVRLLPDYLWEVVAPEIRTTLLDTFSFDHRALGQDVVLSELFSAIQRVAGVAYVDVDILDAVDETADITTLTELAANLKLNPRIEAQMARIDKKATNPDKHIRPAQLVYLSPDVPDTLILTELT